MPAPEEIETLIGQVAGGDRSAFRALYRESSAKLFGIALRICRDRAVAEDVLQDAFVEIWRRTGQFAAGRGSGISWLSVIVRSRAIDHLRKRGRVAARETAGSAETEALVEAMPDPAQVADGGVEYMALAACLEQLDPAQREQVLLAYYEGHSREELAARYDAPVNTIKTRLRRALAALRTCLDG